MGECPCRILVTPLRFGRLVSDDRIRHGMHPKFLLRLWVLKILLAEDHVLSQAMTVRLLQADGHEVSVVGTGLKAIDACRDQSFDVVLMDLQLPVLDGLTAIRAIRESQSLRSRVPIWVLTADSSDEVVAACLAAGADGHLTKPLRPKMLLDRLRNPDLCEANQLQNSNAPATSVQRDVLLQSVGQDRALAKSLVELFQRDYDSLVKRFEIAFDTQDFKTLTSEAHSLKSPARVFGASDLHCLCDDLEKIGQRCDADQLANINQSFLCKLTQLHQAVATLDFE